MKKIEIIFLALCLAFCWVNYVNAWVSAAFAATEPNPFAGKPFTCIKCMCGWFALVLGCYVYGVAGVLLLPAGVFTGAMFEAVSMRWL